MTACRATDNGYVCNKSADHVGEHAARNQFAFDGPILHRWPNAPAPDHGPLAAHLSERTLDKVLSRPAYVPPLVMLDRDAAAQHLADMVTDLLTMPGVRQCDPDVYDRARQALADYRETTS